MQNDPYEKFKQINPNDKIVHQNPPNCKHKMFKTGEDGATQRKEIMRESPNRRWKQWFPNQ